MNTTLSLNDLKALIKFAKDNGIPKLKAGDFECELPPKDANQKELDALKLKVLALESTCQRISLQLEGSMVPRATHKPFSARIDLQRKATI